MKELVVVVSDDVDLFDSIRAAERYLEAWQVRVGVIVFDSAGQPLRAVVVENLWPKLSGWRRSPTPSPKCPRAEGRVDPAHCSERTHR